MPAVEGIVTIRQEAGGLIGGAVGGDDIGKSLKDAGKSLKDAGKVVSDTLSQISPMGGVAGKIGGAIGGGRTEGVGGILGGLTTGIGKVALVGAATTAIISTLKAINDTIEEMRKTMEKASPSFKGMQNLMERQWNMVLRPFGDVLTAIMIPYLRLSMLFMKDQMKKIREVIKGAGGVEELTQEDIDKIMEITKGSLEGLGFIFKQMSVITTPMLANIKGFTDALGIVFNTALVGISGYLSGFASGLGTVFLDFPEDLGTFIRGKVDENISFIENIPKNVAGAWLNTLTSDEAKGILAGTVSGTEGFAAWLKTELTSQEKADAVQNSIFKFADDFYGWMSSALSGVEAEKPTEGWWKPPTGKSVAEIAGGESPYAWIEEYKKSGYPKVAHGGTTINATLNATINEEIDLDEAERKLGKGIVSTMRGIGLAG